MSMTALVPEIPRTPLERLRRAALDGWIIAVRDLTYWVREPARVVFTLMYPIMMVLLFGYVFGSAMTVAGGGDYREFLIPDMFNSTLDLVILVACGLVVSWRWHGTLTAALTAFGLLLLLRFSIIWLGIYVGLILRTPGAAGNAWGLMFPITMIANTFVSPSQMPGWLGTIAEWNPMSATVTATRELFGNPGLGGEAWVTENSLMMAIVWPIVICLIFAPLAVRRFRKLSI